MVTIDYGYRDVPGKIAIAGSVLKMHCSNVVSSEILILESVHAVNSKDIYLVGVVQML